MSDTPEQKLYNALKVLLHSQHIYDHLRVHDPMALKQALAAVDYADEQLFAAFRVEAEETRFGRA